MAIVLGLSTLAVLVVRTGDEEVDVEGWDMAIVDVLGSVAVDVLAEEVMLK